MSTLLDAAARTFGGNGGVAPNVTGPLFGKDHNGVTVVNSSTFSAAMAVLRTPAGHDVNSASLFVNPPSWWSYESGLSTDDTTKPSGKNILAQVQMLQAAGIEPMVVQWVRDPSADQSAADPHCLAPVAARHLMHLRWPDDCGWIRPCSARTPAGISRSPLSTRRLKLTGRRGTISELFY